MHCKSCDKELTDDEAVRRDPRDKAQFLDLCDDCYFFNDDDEINWEDLDTTSFNTEDLV